MTWKRIKIISEGFQESNNSRYRIVDNTGNETGNEYTVVGIFKRIFFPGLR